MSDSPVIELVDVSFGYSAEQPLFARVSLALDPGGCYRLAGVSGTGKSTFLRLICRLEEPTSGTIRFQGQSLADLAPPGLRRQVVLVPQTPVALEASVRENLLLPYRFRSNRELSPPGDEILRRELDRLLLGDVDLQDNARTLSVGQLQRLCLVRALQLRPAVLLLDEPWSALDEESCQAAAARIEAIREESRCCVVLVSHGSQGFETVQPARLELVERCVREAS